MTNDFDAQLSRTLSAATENIRRAVAASFTPAWKIQLAPHLLEGLAQAIAPLQPTLDRLDSMMPENWQGQRLPYKDMILLMQEGVPLAWVPPAGVIRQLLAAEDATERAEIIDDCRPEILDACTETLETVTDIRLTTQTALLAECVQMTERGMFNGAQALAANVWDTLFRGLAFGNSAWLTEKGWWSYKRIQERIPSFDVGKDSTIGQFRKAAVFLPFPATLEEFRRPQPVPHAFNRHATAHATGAVQYSAANAMTALMLASSVLREIDDQEYSLEFHA
ncbi:hypothetical protein [Streptomyces anthocyanicus]|uniref:hypothetical protein n=1 Tax=Streptomyces anthocyanicus TaxID=68174 RepID=UPI002F91AD27|nr:hypothetical protein OH747_41355 [Streptomyces anthocyanicus]